MQVFDILTEHPQGVRPPFLPAVSTSLDHRERAMVGERRRTYGKKTKKKQSKWDVISTCSTRLYEPIKAARVYVVLGMIRITIPGCV